MESSGVLRFTALAAGIWLGGMGLGLVGCRSPSPSPADRLGGGAAASSASDQPRVRALGGGQGRIVQVQKALGFVVVDFSLNTVPVPDQLLGVYRDGQWVGEIKVGRIARGTTVSADIVRGELFPGDEARPQ